MPRQNVKSEITGKVWKIEAIPGDIVEEDQAILILESMKMEIPVSAPIRCKVLRVLVTEGEPVTEGDIVAEIEV